MYKALIKGLIDFGLKIYDSNNKLLEMEDWDAGYKQGRSEMLDAIMQKMVGYEDWEAAKVLHITHKQKLEDATANRN